MELFLMAYDSGTLQLFPMDVYEDTIHVLLIGSFLKVGKEWYRPGQSIHRTPNFNIIRESTIDIFRNKPCLREREEDES